MENKFNIKSNENLINKEKSEIIDKLKEQSCSNVSNVEFEAVSKEQSSSNVEDETIVTMVDVLEEEKQLEDQTHAVLAGSDDLKCSYHLGYVPRQALYSCKTCYIKKGTEHLAGLCLACSLSCHEGHELYELYTKRNFRCDCGNSKFPSECNLILKSETLNNENKYNHNFIGQYCICNRPYPDATFTDTMIQCIICEDWLHESHTGSKIPDEFSEFICKSCMKSLPFLHYYQLVNLEETNDVDSGIDSSSDSTTLSECKLQKLKNENQLKLDEKSDICTFWSSKWRTYLCKCSACLKIYKELKCEYLTDQEDTVESYEAKGNEKTTQISQYELGLSKISKLDRVKSIEAIKECEIMSTRLRNHFRDFALHNKIVKEEDVLEFFEQFKRARREEEKERQKNFDQ